MDKRFLIHNLHRESIEAFQGGDPDLRKLATLRLVHTPSILQELPKGQAGIYTLVGGRQVGKTTLVKQWMERLVLSGVPPSHVSFVTGDVIDDYKELLYHLEEILKSPLESMAHLRVLIVDEITYIKEWDRAVKYLADAGLLEHTILLLTGSDAVILSEARVRFPGRRGKAKKVDFELFPLSFRDTVLLKNSSKEFADEELTLLWSEYLKHGGYLTAINEFHSEECISPSTFRTYSNWIRGDVLKRQKNENTLREVLAALVKRHSAQVTWNALAKDLSIEHPTTLASYVELLSSMHVLFVQHALDQSKNRAAPKKAKKIHFLDPFIFHAIRGWVTNTEEPFQEQVQSIDGDPELSSVLSESAAVSHVKRSFPLFYIKAEGEIDIAYLQNKLLQLVEVKWRNQLRAVDVKQLSKYGNVSIWSKHHNEELFGIRNVFLPRAVFEFG